MNRYEFEDKISDYLDNQLSISERKEFESFLENDDESHVLLESVRKTIKLLDSPWPIKACLLYTSPSPRDQRGSGMPACG